MSAAAVSGGWWPQTRSAQCGQHCLRRQQAMVNATAAACWACWQANVSTRQPTQCFTTARESASCWLCCLCAVQQLFVTSCKMHTHLHSSAVGLFAPAPTHTLTLAHPMLATAHLGSKQRAAPLRCVPYSSWSVSCCYCGQSSISISSTPNSVSSGAQQ